MVAAIFIILSDSKLYPTLANLLYVFGIILMLSVFVLGKDINGSKSWIPLGGGFNAFLSVSMLFVASKPGNVRDESDDMFFCPSGA